MKANLQTRKATFTLKNLIKKRQALLANRIGDDAQDPILDHPADFFTQASLGNIQDMSLTLRDRQLETLRNIDAAIERVKSATYGVCSECTNKIESKRLQACPETSLCIRCKEIEEEQARNAPQVPLALFDGRKIPLWGRFPMEYY